MSAIDRYRELVDAAAAQRERLGISPLTFERWSKVAPGYRFDPRRDPEPNLAILASYVEPEDELVEVGGGAGRTALPLALRCRQVTNVEPAAGMRAEFESLAAEAGIDNVELVASTWAEAPPLAADIVVTVDVSYFVAEIGPFVEKLETTARRRVIMSVWDPPPPNWEATLHELVHGEPLAPAPGLRELLPALWELGFLPDVLVLPEVFSWPEPKLETREQALRYALRLVEAPDDAAHSATVEAAFDDLFRYDAGEFVPRWRRDAPGVLITWETGRRRGG